MKEKAYRLDSDYLIFAYQLVDYKFTIKNFWLKKVWQITGSSKDYPVKCQVKQKAIINIRPISWYSKKAKFQPFANRRAFVEALYETLLQYPKTQGANTNWLREVEQNYFTHTQENL